MSSERKFTNPCGGCGEVYSSRRCIGCLHEMPSAPTQSQDPCSLAEAAPDLLEALKAMLENYGPPLASVDYPAAHPISLARAAIAKATGGRMDE